MFKKFSLIVVMILTTIALVACNREEEIKDYELVEITHNVSKFDKMDGETAVYKKVEVTEEFYVNPKKVITFSWAIVDIIGHFGIEELGIERLGLPTQTSNVPSIIKGFDNVSYVDAGTLHDIDYNAIDLMNPDLIILDGRTASQYEFIKENYPNTNVLDASSTTYSIEVQESIFNNLGNIFPNIKDDLNSKMDEFKADFEEISLVGKNYKASIIMLNGNKFSYQIGKNSRFGAIHNQFGLLEADPNGQEYENNSHGYEISSEYISEINPEVIFFMDRNLIVNSESSDRTFLNEPSLANVSAIKNEMLFDLNAEAWYTVSGGIQSTEQMIADLRTFVNKQSNSNWQNLT